jgi:hypothetical protein
VTLADRLIIIGAGLAGLLAGNMLRRRPLQIVERQACLPNNHHAVLRFRSCKVAEQVHVPFRAVRVFKSIDEPDPIRAAMLYAHKVTGRYEVRSLINLEPSERYIAPPNLVELMAHGLDIAYGVDGLAYVAPEQREKMGMSPIISTLPMPLLMDALEYDGERPEFAHEAGFTIKAKVKNCDIFATRYYARSANQLYRASITGDNLIMEFVGEPAHDLRLYDRVIEDVVIDFGIIVHDDVHEITEPKQSKYQKLAKLSDDDRKRAMAFMHWATVNWQVYSLGRFAKWEAGLLLDDVVQDVLKIERWIDAHCGYELKKEMKG